MTEQPVVNAFEVRLVRLLEMHAAPAVRPIDAADVAHRAATNARAQWRPRLALPRGTVSWGWVALLLALIISAGAFVGATLLFRAPPRVPSPSLQVVAPPSASSSPVISGAQLQAGAIVRDFAWSPDGSQIAAMVEVPPDASTAGVGSREVWLVNLYGPSAHAVVAGIDQIADVRDSLAWSSSSAYLSYATGSNATEILDLASGVITSVDGQVTWSPTRDEILVRGTDRSQIALPDGSAVAEFQVDCCLEWSPNGDALMGETGLIDGGIGPDTATQIYRRDGSLLNEIASANAFFSATGSRVIYDDTAGNYISANLDGSDSRREPAFYGVMNEFAASEWSPDGQLLAILGNGPTGNLSTISVDGTSKILVEGIDGQNPGWSSDGTRIRYYDQSVQHPGWFVLGLDGEQPRLVTEIAAGFVSWRPGSSDTLAFVRDGSLVSIGFDGQVAGGRSTLLVQGHPRLDTASDNHNITIDDNGPSSMIVHAHAGIPLVATFENTTGDAWSVEFETTLIAADCSVATPGANVREGIRCTIAPHQTLTFHVTTWPEGIGEVSVAVSHLDAVDADGRVEAPYYRMMLDVSSR